jgi:hypothetical protein
MKLLAWSQVLRSLAPGFGYFGCEIEVEDDVLAKEVLDNCRCGGCLFVRGWLDDG